LYSGSLDSSIKQLDLVKGAVVQLYPKKSVDTDLPISGVAISSSDPNVLYFSTVNGSLGRHDIRKPSDTKLWKISSRKIGGFSIHPSHPHLLATASLDGTLKLWDLRKLTVNKNSLQLSLIGEHKSERRVSHASWSSTGNVATACYDNTVRIHSLPPSGNFGLGHTINSEGMAPTTTIRHSNHSDHFEIVLKPQWQESPADVIQKFVIGNMSKAVDIYTGACEQLTQMGGKFVTAVPAVTHFHPSQNWVAAGTIDGKLYLWM